MRGSVVLSLPAGICGFLAVAFAWSGAVAGLHAPVNAFDEGLVLVNPQLLLDGLVPGRDFESTYPPGSMLLLAGPFALVGPSVRIERYVAMLVATAVVVAFAIVGRRRGAGAASALVAVPAVFALPLLPKAASCALAAWALAVAVLDRPVRTRRDEVLAGVLLGVAVSCRLDWLPGAVLTGLVAGVVPAPDRRATAVRVGVGAVLGLAPLIWLAAVHPPSVARLVWAPLRFQPARDLPFPGWRHPDSWPLWIGLAACALAIVAAWRARQRGDTRSAALFATGAGAALFSLPYATGRWDIVHTVVPLAHVGPLVPVALNSLLRSPPRLRTIAGPAAAVGIVATLLLMTPHLRTLVGERRSSEWVTIAGRSLPLEPQQTGPVSEVVDAVAGAAPAGSRLFVGPHDLRRTPLNDVFLYHLLPDHAPASFYTELNPGIADRPGSRLAGDLQTADVLVLNRSLDGWDEPNASARLGPEAPNEVVRRHFCVAHDVDPWVVYVRC